jgi:hypothetical protein
MLLFVITKALRDGNPILFTEVGESLSLDKRERHRNNICERKASKTVLADAADIEHFSNGQVTLCY